MKSLIALLFLLFTACTKDVAHIMVSPSELKFKAGDRVQILIGFYSNCDGIIIDYNSYKYMNDVVRYKVQLDCPNVGGFVIRGVVHGVLETDLKRKL